MSDPVMTDLAADVVGPDVKFHHAKLNVKSERGTRGFKWHQDIPAWPHTDYSPVSIGVYLTGCDMQQGPLSFVRGSHLGPLHSQYTVPAPSWCACGMRWCSQFPTTKLSPRPAVPARRCC